MDITILGKASIHQPSMLILQGPGDVKTAVDDVVLLQDESIQAIICSAQPCLDDPDTLFVSNMMPGEIYIGVCDVGQGQSVCGWQMHAEPRWGLHTLQVECSRSRHPMY